MGKPFSFSHMAHLPNQQPLNPDIFILRLITNKTTLTIPSLHDIFNQNFSPHCQATPWHISPTPHWLLSHEDHFSGPLIGHHHTWLFMNSSLLIIIPGTCIASHALVTSRSLATPPKPCSIYHNLLYTSLLHCICLVTACIHSHFVHLVL